MSTAVDTGAVALDTSEDRLRAQRIAAARRRKRQVQNVVIRVISVAIVLALWEILGNHIGSSVTDWPRFNQ